MADTVTDEDFLLALLNSTPVIDGVPADDLADPVRARDWLAAAGGLGTETELRHVLRVRESLQAVVRGQQPAAVLAPELEDVISVPAIDDGRVGWTLCVAPDRKLAVRAVLAWDALARQSPGTAAPVRERRVPPVPHRPQQGQRRPVVLDGRLRQQDEGPPPLPAFTHLAPPPTIRRISQSAQRCADGAIRPCRNRDAACCGAQPAAAFKLGGERGLA